MATEAVAESANDSSNNVSTKVVNPAPLGTRLIVDIGSQNARMGFAGSAYPEATIPSWFVENESAGDGNVGHSNLAMYAPQVELRPTVSKGRVESWDGMESLWKYILDDILKVDPKDHQILLCESVFSKQEDREKWAEFLFEKCEIPALFIAREAPLCLYANARTTGLALNVGHSYSFAAPVQDGFYMEDNLETTSLAGASLTARLLEYVEKKQQKAVTPRYKFTRKTDRQGEVVVTHVDSPATPSFETYWKLDLCRQLKEQECSVRELENWRDVDVAQDSDSVNENSTYVLPDGTEIDLTEEITKGTGEMLFDSSLKCGTQGRTPIHTAVLASAKGIKSSELRLRLLSNVVLTGGSSRMPGLAHRLRAELASISKTLHSKSRVIAAGKTERGFATWLGGSIMGSLESLDDNLWVTKSEYEEHGGEVLRHKCP